MSSPFLLVPEVDWIASNALAFAIRDKYPVSPGHALVIPKRVVATYWEATAEERAAIWELVEEVKRRLDEGGARDAKGERPHGYNIGFNSGEAAGQTVFHLHVHVIPRFRGDVADPRGGVRWVIPGRANYLAESLREATQGLELLPGGDRRMLDEMLARLGDKSFDRVDLIISFIMRSGLELVAPALEAALERGVAVRILTTDYLNITDAQALLRLADLCVANPERLAVRVFHDDATSFHPKGYLFWSSSGAAAVAVVGSSNLSKSALAGGIEWNVVTAASGEMRREFEKLWNDRRSAPPTREWLLKYRQSQPEGDERVQFKTPREMPAAVVPHAIQKEALDALKETRAELVGQVVLVVDIQQRDDESRPIVRSPDAARRLDVLGVGFRLTVDHHQTEARLVEADRDHVRRERAVDAILLVETAGEPPAGLGDLISRYARRQLQDLREGSAILKEPRLFAHTLA